MGSPNDELRWTIIAQKAFTQARTESRPVYTSDGSIYGVAYSDAYSDIDLDLISTVTSIQCGDYCDIDGVRYYVTEIIYNRMLWGGVRLTVHARCSRSPDSSGASEAPPAHPAPKRKPMRAITLED